MKTLTTISEMRAWTAAQQDRGLRVGFVPTLGGLHVGHKTLMQQAAAENDVVALSLFLNPMQFRPARYHEYPRDLNEDTALAESAGIAAVFAPSVAEMFGGASLDEVFACQHLPESERPATEFRSEQRWGPEGPPFIRAPAELALRLDGALHPWFYDGIATIVPRLFEAVPAHAAYFGEKDPLQLTLVRRLMRWQSSPIEIRPVPTVRDPDGLAASSRNVKLDETQRDRAVAMAAAVKRGAELVTAGEMSLDEIRERVESELHAVDANLDFFDILDPMTMDRARELSGEVLLYVAFYIDGLRLADERVARCGA